MEHILKALEEEFDFLVQQLQVTFDHDELMKLSGRVVSLYGTIKLIKDEG
jgi:hypothetical protein